VDSVHYPPVNPRIVSDTLDKQTWIEISLFAKLNIKEMFAGLCLKVSRNIRTSFGPYSIRKLESGAVMEVPLNDELKQFLSLHNKSKWIHAAAPHTSDETALSHIQ
jgi:16S rRNA U516 pseudouridylate synthase RsuA-like enzyme